MASVPGIAHSPVPLEGLVATTIIALASISVLAVCLSKRIGVLKSWRTLPITHWLVLLIYVDSAAFVSATFILSHGFGLNSTIEIMYYLLVEKAYIVNETIQPRMKCKSYLFNCFGMLLPYVIVIALNFVFRFAWFNDKGICIVGMKLKAMMPLIIFDVIVNVYLTALFIIPLRRLSRQGIESSKLRIVTVRTFIGSLSTLTSSVVNLTVLMALRGEPAWICLMCCNIDILFSTCVLHWITNNDTVKAESEPTSIDTSDASKSPDQLAPDQLTRCCEHPLRLPPRQRTSLDTPIDITPPTPTIEEKKAPLLILTPSNPSPSSSPGQLRKGPDRGDKAPKGCLEASALYYATREFKRRTGQFHGKDRPMPNLVQTPATETMEETSNAKRHPVF
ncbi:hypothetical protein BP6252_11285 [Coleophoma cylindrospora]|uniref:Uncharacterized protein n=1 Tax=Coleophoma cylindrospora TaxID=1849047 RepID=A0A3D8QQ20_9HELO|nr:hypothetical protein BP6252_11285 [Coleophoma cylindrospora]